MKNLWDTLKNLGDILFILLFIAIVSAFGFAELEEKAKQNEFLMQENKQLRVYIGDMVDIIYSYGCYGNQ